MSAAIRISCVLATLVPLLFSPVRGEDVKGREMVGLRIGGLRTTGQMRSTFGSGTELELHFIEGLKPWLGLGGSFSSHNFGASKDRDKNIEYTGMDTKVDLQIYSITLTVVTMAPSWKRITPSLEGGFGLYTITTVIDAGIFEGRRTDNQLGFYGGAGFRIKLTETLSLDANFKYHHVLSGETDRHPVYFYTGEDRTDIFQIAAGVVIFTG